MTILAGCAGKHRFSVSCLLGSNVVSPELTAFALLFLSSFLLKAQGKPSDFIMSVAHNSDQVVEDYKSSLLDLTQNNKHEINLLTVIASEYIGKAVELSRVLETHIRNVCRNPWQLRTLAASYIIYITY